MKIGLFGVPGFNRGDDAITLSLIEGFRRACPNATFVVATLRSRPNFHDKNVAFFEINRRTLSGYFSILLSIAKVDLVVIGGGSLLQDKMGGDRLNGVLGYAWTVTFLSKIFRKVIVTAPIGIDELTSKRGRDAAREVLARVKFLAVRDGLSKKIGLELLENSLVPQVFCDPVFGWNPAVSDIGNIPVGSIVLAPAFEGAGDENIALLFACIAKELMHYFPGIPICLIAMDERKDEDAGKLSLIRRHLNTEQNQIVTDFIPRSAVEARECLIKSRGVVAMRLHAIIIAYGYVPIFCISRTTKTDALIAEYSVDGLKLGSLSDSMIADGAYQTLKRGDIKLHKSRRAKMFSSLQAYYRSALDAAPTHRQCEQ